VTLAEDEVKIAETVGDQTSYWSRNTFYKVISSVKKSGVIDYTRIRSGKGIHYAFRSNLLLELISKSMTNEDFSLVDTIKEEMNLSSQETKEWEGFEAQIKSRDLQSFDYKLSALNKIIKMTFENAKAGIEN